MNKTTNYQLNQWEPEDQVRRTDFNEDNAKLDAALAALEDGKVNTSALAAVQAQLAAVQTLAAGKGNCRIETGSYVGDGNRGRILTITASFPPKLVIITGSGLVVMCPGMNEAICFSGHTSGMTVSWQGNSVSWRCISTTNSASEIMNAEQTYYYVILA